ncbi:PAS domain-containing sensor histidine kinase [Desulfosporosinus sp. Sb-LF]|uniref:PAS domain-containing sensor histidine kinase n=1 Tax=Desulfosporosinus sp. Sb-LF TaxID=2560027 RepID=UPI0013053944|nr:PAS domain-containing sensor histidine kinase [Desulfosporosinus sp. Sb-LF]
MEQDLDGLLLSHLFDSIPDACVVLDERYFIVKMNSKAEQIFLYPREYMMSKVIWEITPQYINTKLFHAMAKVRNDGKEMKFEFCGGTSNRWFGATLCMMGNCLVLFFNDITHIKHTQNELLRAEERFSAVFRNSHALMSIISLENKQHISVNNSYANFFGYTSNEIIGKTKEDVFLTADSMPAETQIQHQSGKNTLSGVITVKTRSNEYKSIIVSSEPININGKPCQLEIGIDMTDKLRYQKELIKLEHLNILGQMSASIAHEIRNPLQTVKGFLQFLQSKEGVLPYQDYFKLMIDELNRANQIITEFLSLSRTKPTDLQLCDINDILKSVLPLIQAQAIEEDKLIEVELKSGTKTMLDVDEIKQVILNLVKNGLEATLPKGRVKLITEDDHRSVKLIVCDHGKGIPIELQENIGMPFFTTKKDGTGLGLSMSLSILERHKANLRFVSNEEGTTFYIDFPIN